MPDTFAPPTEPPALLDEPRTWPKVVGIISIVWAGIGVVCNVCSVFSPQVMMQVLPEELTKPPLPPNMTPNALMYGLSGVGFFASVLLLVAGIMLVGRKRAARPMHLVWAIGAVLLCLGAIFMQWTMHEEMKSWIQQNPDSPWSKQAKSGPGGGDMSLIIGIVMTLAIGLAYPLFCLVWFGLVKRNPAEIDAGVEDSVV